MHILVFIERVGDLYVGAGHDHHGRKLLEVAEPLSYSAIHARMVAAGATLFGDCVDIDGAIDDADKRPDDPNAKARRAYFDLGVRAHAGTATAADVEWVAGQLINPGSLHPATPLIGAVADMRSVEHEALIATLVEWIPADPPHTFSQGLAGLAHSYAGRFISKHSNAKILRALLDAATAGMETSMQEHAIECLYPVLGIENELLADIPYGSPRRVTNPTFRADVIERARLLLFDWEHGTRRQSPSETADDADP